MNVQKCKAIRTGNKNALDVGADPRFTCFASPDVSQASGIVILLADRVKSTWIVDLLEIPLGFRAWSQVLSLTNSLYCSRVILLLQVFVSV
jgi:hypothetical protein